MDEIEKEKPSPGGLRQVWGRLLSLDFGVGVFHDFSRMNFGGNELMQVRTLTPQQAVTVSGGFVRKARWEPQFNFGRRTRSCQRLGVGR